MIKKDPTMEKQDLNSAVISNLIQILSNYVFINKSVPEHPIYFFISPHNSWANYTFEESDLLLSKEDDMITLLEKTNKVISINNSSSVQPNPKAENMLAELIFENWNEIFQFRVFLSTNGDYEIVSSANKDIRFCSAANSKKYIDNRSKNGLIALTPNS